jgi:D-xylose transport system permease protein
MNKSLDQTNTDRPLAAADLVVASETATLTRQTKIGRFKISTDVLRAYTMVFALIAIWAFFHYSTDQIFLDPRNFSNLMRQTAVTGVLAVGMLMVIITGQIDLSVGSVVGLAGGIAAIAQGWYDWGLVPSISAGVAIALVIGAFQGSLVAYVNVPAFIVTLGGLLAWRGVILGLSRGETIPLRLQEFKSIGQDYVGPTIGWIIAAVAVAAIIWLTISRNRARKRHGVAVPSTGSTLLRAAGPAIAVVGFIYMMNAYEISPGRYAGVPVPVIIFLAIALGGAFLTRNTTFGRYLYAIGGNPDAARLSGINIRRHILAVFCIMGALTGVASIIYTARVGSASPDAGQLLELDAIAACVIGGTSLMGGRGTVFGAILGALIMASLDNGMSLKSVEPYMQNIIKGAILVAAVGLDMAGRRRG